jgi:phasin family protein
MAKSTATSNFDPTAAFAMPNVDVDAVMAAQRRNVEALTTANQIAADGVKTFAALQSDILRRTMDGYAAAVTGMMSAGDPKTGAVKQAAFAKDSFEKSVDDARELAAIATATQAKTLDVINKRVAEGIDEFQAIATKA